MHFVIVSGKIASGCVQRHYLQFSALPQVDEVHRGGIFKLLRSPRIDSKESTSPALVPVGPLRQPYSYSAPSPHRLF
jgi:hypothetical protein